MVKESAFIHSIGGIIGSFSIQILHPFDVIKTRAQAFDKNSIFNNVQKYDSLFQTGKNIIQKEGFKSLFKGLGIGLFASNISYGLFFGLYRASKNYFDFIQNNKIKNFFSGFISSIFAVGLVQPLWTIKTRRIIDNNNYNNLSYKNLYNEIKVKDGIKGFYKGYTLSLIWGMNAVIQLSFYDSIKDYFKESNKVYNNYFTFLNGIFSRTFATLVMYPFNTMRTKIQQNSHFKGQIKPKYCNIRSVFQYILKNEGIKGFYRGIIPHFFRSMPSNGLFFLAYENTIKILNDHKKNMKFI